MAENIVELLTDVADAIREKKGSNEPINAQDFANEIKNLPSGGEVAVFAENMVDKTGKGIQTIESVIFPSGITTISEKAYYYCSGIKSIQIPEGVITIYPFAFGYCSAIRSITLPSTIASLGQQCFAQTTALESFYIPIDAPVTLLPRNLFWNSPLLKKVVIPKYVTSLAGYVFENCSGLVYVDFSNLMAVPNLENNNAFSGTSCVIIVPDALYEDWITATNWSSLADRIVKNSEYTRPL